MKLKTVMLSSLFLLISYSYVSAKTFVISANATSSSITSGSVNCLFNGCGTYWSPDVKDSGVDEGLYLKFKNGVRVDFVEVDVEDKRDSLLLQLYLNGKTTSPSGIVFGSWQKGKKTIVFGGRGRIGLQTYAESFFLKVMSNTSRKNIKIKAIRIYKKQGSSINQVELQFPDEAKAKVSATSTLKPETAYHPSNIFDSKYSSAWSTDGNKTDGIGESFLVTFPEKQNIKELIFWNGYQRSSTHFTKNGCIKKVLIKSGDFSQTINLKAVMGAQRIELDRSINVSDISFRILQIRKGTRYKDVLLSELRFVNNEGNIILPKVKSPEINISSNWKGFIDRSWSSVFHFADECGLICNNKRIRLRSNGTFVIYKNFDYGVSTSEDVTAKVLEGNWETKGKRLRIFGKRYTTSLRSSEYLTNKTKPAASIFQSYLTIKRYHSLSRKEKKQIFDSILSTRKIKTGKNLFISNVINKDRGTSGENKNDLYDKIDKLLTKHNPYYLKSSVFTDYILMTDKLNSCFSDCP
ncbi:MAG: hypothetical protein GY760_27910 [Deltaproteobacteria bacterium]|nr:hypothetical protein [Deltaproteobacteria bacterium]